MPLKSPPPGAWYWTACSACVVLTAALLSYDRWAAWGIEAQFGAGESIPVELVALRRVDVVTIPYFELRRVSVALGNCSPLHFWGQAIYYRDDDTGIPGDIYVHVGRACRDWTNGRWVLVKDIPWGWSRYWRP